MRRAFDGLSGDDLAAHGGLHRNLKHLAGDVLLQLFADLPGTGVGTVGKEDEGQRVDNIAVEQNIQLDQLAGPVAVELIVQRARSPGCGI